MATPSLVVFDLYGTLVRFGIQLHPFRKILKWAREQGRVPTPDDARLIMTIDATTETILHRMGINPPDAMLDQLHEEIEQELSSLTLFEDVKPTLTRLDQRGIAVAVCSNLAKPYGAVIDRLLPEFTGRRCLSYEVGAIKPDPAIYNLLIKDTAMDAQSVLFVGDTRLADFEGPRQHGFDALHLERDTPKETGSIRTLTSVIHHIDQEFLRKNKR